MKYQAVDENDIEQGPLSKKELSGAIHRRVALLLINEEGKILSLGNDSDWDIPHRAVPYRQSSESTARELLDDLGIQSALMPLGGTLQLRDQYSTQTHLFLGRWSGQEPRLYEDYTVWEAQPVPLPDRHNGPYKHFARRALRGRPRSMRIREDLR